MDKIEKRTLIAYGESYVTVFHTLLNSDKFNAREQSIEAGKRALVIWYEPKLLRNWGHLPIAI
jgi:hypothetical protein